MRVSGGKEMSVKRYEWVACDEHSCHCDVVESAEGDMVDYDDYAELEQQLAESHRALRAETTAHENTQMQLDKLAAENGVLLAIMNEQAGSFGAALAEGFHDAVMESGSDQLIDIYQRRLQQAIQCIPPTPATDAFLAEIKTAIEYPKNNSSSNGWTIDPEFLSRVEERAGAVYGYYPGLEETEAALLAGMDLLRERAAQ